MIDALELEERASRGYQAFCDNARAFLPTYMPDWPLLPEAVKNAWKAAASAVLKQSAS